MGFLDKLLGRRPPEDDPRRALYVHLARDGGIFVVRGNGEQLWTDRDGLQAELERTKELGGRLLYSRDDPEEDPPEHVVETFQFIVDYELPVQLLEKPHPEAAVPPDRRRDLLNE